MLHKKDLSRIKEVLYCAEEDKPVDRTDIVKGYEYSKGDYIVIDPDELKKIAPPTARTMEIVQFVRSGEVDPIFLEESYYITPDEAVSKPYALLLNAMTQTKYYAIAKVSMHAREHIVVIRPTSHGMVLHTMYYVDELHKANETFTAADAQFNEKEMDLAKRLIEALASPFKPEQYHDTYRENVMRLLDQKQKGQKITAVKQPKMAPVVDILTALQQSLRPTAKHSRATPEKKTVKKRSRNAA